MQSQKPHIEKSVAWHHAKSKDGTRIGYKRSGSGPPLLLVHGTTADHSRWARISPALETEFTVCAMDRRGRGESGDGEPYALEREFEDVAAVVDAIDQPVDVFGHSYGALCALEAALLTRNIRRLILYEPPLITGSDLYPPGFVDHMQQLLEKGELETALEIFFRDVVKMPDHEFEVYRSLPAWQVRITLAPTIPRETVSEQNYTFQPERFASFSTPTLLLLGGDSSPAFSGGIEQLNAALPVTRVAVLPGQQHVAMDTAPELFLQEVTGFLSS